MEQMIRETGRTLCYAGLIAEGKWEEIGNLLFESYGDSKDFFENGHPDITTCIDVLKEIGVEVFDYDRFEIERFDASTFEFAKMDVDRLEPVQLEMTFLRRGVIGINSVGYVV